MSKQKLSQELSKHYTDKEIAELFGISVQTLRIHRCKGVGFPYVKICGSVRYNLEACNKYLSQNSVNFAA